VLTLTEEEKREARSTDARAAAIAGRGGRPCTGSGTDDATERRRLILHHKRDEKVRVRTRYMVDTVAPAPA
jgi:hypothetical protein